MARSPSGLTDSNIDELLSLFQYAAAIVDETGHVISANPALRQCSDDGLDIIRRKLTCIRASEQANLDSMIRNVTKVPSKRLTPDIVLITRPSGRRPLLIKAMPLHSSNFGCCYRAAIPRPQALVMVVNLESEGILMPEKALQRLGLTYTEAKVAALIGSGHSPQEVATLQGVSEGTIRNQLKCVFAKLNISRQSELAIIISKTSIL